MRFDILDLVWRILGSRWFTLGVVVALMLVFACGAILPQIPEEATSHSPEYARWRADLRVRYLQWADPLTNWGFFSIRDSYWLEIPLALLMVNLVVCAVDRYDNMRRRHRPTSQQLTAAFNRGSVSRRFLAVESTESALSRLRSVLEARRYSVNVQDIDGNTHVTALRFPSAEWGSLCGHVGLILIIASMLLGPRLGWRESGMALAPAQELQLRHAPSLSVRLNHFDADLYPNSSPVSYEADVTLLAQGSEVARGSVSPGEPLWHGVMSVHQVSHGPLVTIAATGADGDPLLLQALAQSGTRHEKVSLQLSEGENEGYVAVPQRNLILTLVLQPEPTPELRSSPSLLVQAYSEGTTEPVFSETLRDSSLLQIEGDRYAIEWRHYAVLTAARDPSLVPMMVGATVLLAGVIASSTLRPRTIWATVRGHESVVEVQLRHPGDGDRRVSRQELDRLVAEI